MNETQKEFCQKEIIELVGKIAKSKSWARTGPTEKDQVYWQTHMESYEAQKRLFELELQSVPPPPRLREIAENIFHRSSPSRYIDHSGCRVFPPGTPPSGCLPGSSYEASCRGCRLPSQLRCDAIW
jgi:hypothetical protein